MTFDSREDQKTGGLNVRKNRENHKTRRGVQGLDIRTSPFACTWGNRGKRGIRTDGLRLLPRYTSSSPVSSPSPSVSASSSPSLVSAGSWISSTPATMEAWRDPVLHRVVRRVGDVAGVVARDVATDDEVRIEDPSDEWSGLIVGSSSVVP